ncbi:eCIS core domain-containing protein [Streptomyces hiroshimensis]
MGLQGAVGNAAVVQMLRAAGHLGEEGEPRHAVHRRHGETGRPAVQRSAVHEVLRRPGRPLDDATRADMEARLGADFSDVRVHSGAAARASAAEIGARAYTSGSHVVIGAGGGDKHTLAHELTQREETAVQRVNDSGNRPLISHANPNDDWFADNATAVRADGLVLSGHGGWERVDGHFRVPRGTRLHFYTVHGQTVPDDLGGQVEQGNEQRGSVEQSRQPGASRTLAGGRSAPNYRISYPSGLTIRGNPVIATPVAGGYDVELDPATPAARVITVATLLDPQLAGHSIVFDGDVLLSDILQTDMGDVHFAACRFVETGRPGTRNQKEGLFNP